MGVYAGVQGGKVLTGGVITAKGPRGGGDRSCPASAVGYESYLIRLFIGNYSRRIRLAQDVWHWLAAAETRLTVSRRRLLWHALTTCTHPSIQLDHCEGQRTMAAESSSAARLKLYRPYFSPVEVERLSAKQRGKLSVSREEKGRQQACAFIDAVGTRSGL